MEEKMLVGEERQLEYISRLKGMLAMMDNAPPEQKNPIMEMLMRIVLASDEMTLKCAKENLPMCTTWYGNAPEILTAMGIHFFNPYNNVMVHLGFTDQKDYYGMDTLSLSSEVCTLIRVTMYVQRAGLVLKPGAVIGMLQPCDGQPMLNESYKVHGWDDIPYYYLDYPFGNEDEDLDYFAGELKRMIEFLEETFPGKTMDWDKLREVCTETNKQYALWHEYCNLMRTVPCPMPSLSAILWNLTQHFSPIGNPMATQLVGGIVGKLEQMVKAGVSAAPKEKIRILWADLEAPWLEKIAPWLAEEYGAVVVQSFMGLDSYTPIDTSTPETMLKGLAKRALCDVPMIRQNRTSVDVLISDVQNTIRDFSINCVLYPAHIGHKDVSASSRFVIETCKEMGVPCLVLNIDQMDDRNYPVTDVQRRIKEFFEASGLAD